MKEADEPSRQRQETILPAPPPTRQYNQGKENRSLNYTKFLIPNEKNEITKNYAAFARLLVCSAKQRTLPACTTTMPPPTADNRTLESTQLGTLEFAWLHIGSTRLLKGKTRSGIHEI
ncbi:hypothetical protein CBL_04581 [Carabus blaptoides fortunei]